MYKDDTLRLGFGVAIELQGGKFDGVRLGQYDLPPFLFVIPFSEKPDERDLMLQPSQNGPEDRSWFHTPPPLYQRILPPEIGENTVIPYQLML